MHLGSVHAVISNGGNGPEHTASPKDNGAPTNVAGWHQNRFATSVLNVTS